MNKLKKIVKNKKFVFTVCLVVTTLGLLFIVSGTSYALLSGSSSSGNEQIIKTGDVTIALTESYDEIGNKISVLPDSEGLLEEDVYNFNIKNLGDATARYDIKLVNEVPSSYSGPTIDDKYVKVGLEINGEEHGPFTLEEAENILDSGIIYKNELIEYNLRIWLSEDYEEEILEIDGAKAYFKIEVEAEQSMQEKPPIPIVETIISKVGTDGIVADTHPETEQLGAVTDYRYTGANPNNYITFNNELWRIIGVFPTDDGTGNIENRVKIIRNESIGKIAWNTNDSSDWSTATLQELLNSGDYYNRIGNYTSNGLIEEAKNMIGNAKWYLGGTQEIIMDEDATSEKWYSYERGTSVSGENPINWIGEVGLMYPSDYGYATSGGSEVNRESCLTTLFTDWYNSSYSDCKNNDWLYDSNNSKWTITPLSKWEDAVKVDTVPGRGGSVTSDFYQVYPVVYLSSNVGITGGVGTSNDPYQLSV